MTQLFVEGEAILFKALLYSREHYDLVIDCKTVVYRHF